MKVYFLVSKAPKPLDTFTDIDGSETMIIDQMRKTHRICKLNMKDTLNPTGRIQLLLLLPHKMQIDTECQNVNCCNQDANCTTLNIQNGNDLFD